MEHHSSIINTAYPHRVVGWLLPIYSGQQVGYTLDRSVVCHWATPRQTGQTAVHTLRLKLNLERPINLKVLFLVCGRNPEYLEGSNTCA